MLIGDTQNSKRKEDTHNGVYIRLSYYTENCLAAYYNYDFHAEIQQLKAKTETVFNVKRCRIVLVEKRNLSSLTGMRL